MAESGTAGSAAARSAFPGDDLLPDSRMVFDRRRSIEATPEEIWPWLLQLGKQRAGWYLPGSVERFIPARRRATRTIESRWLGLRVGDRIPDYGGREEWLEVVSIDPAESLVYRSERNGALFTWALLLEPDESGRTVVHLRFRGLLKSTGLLRRLIIFGGEFLDRITADSMLAGLEERVRA